jgi:two-component system, LytTR family, response regulator
MTAFRQIRALLVDDESLARMHLRRLLEVHPEVEVAGEASDAIEAEKLAATINPDVIFLDIEMPRSDGFSFLARLNVPAQIVFVTSHNRYAVKGFEINALDYLVKPVIPARLEMTISRLKEAHLRSGGEQANGTLALDEAIVVGDAKQSRTIPVKSISLIRSEGNYSQLHAVDAAMATLVLRSLGAWEALLPNPPFARIDRSLIVNIVHIQNFQAKSREHALLHLAGLADPIALGRTSSTRLRALLREFDP